MMNNAGTKEMDVAGMAEMNETIYMGTIEMNDVGIKEMMQAKAKEAINDGTEEMIGTRM